MGSLGLVTLVPITAQGLDNVYPAEVLLPAATGLKRDSKAQADQIRTLTARRLRRNVGALPAPLLADVERAIRVHLELRDRPAPEG